MYAARFRSPTSLTAMTSSSLRRTTGLTIIQGGTAICAQIHSASCTLDLTVAKSLHGRSPRVLTGTGCMRSPWIGSHGYSHYTKNEAVVRGPFRS